MAECNNETGIKKDYVMCFTYEKEKECKGAGGRKLRRVCVYCPNYHPEEKERGGSECHRLKESNKP